MRSLHFDPRVMLHYFFLTVRCLGNQSTGWPTGILGNTTHVLKTKEQYRFHSLFLSLFTTAQMSTHPSALWPSQGENSTLPHYDEGIKVTCGFCFSVGGVLHGHAQLLSMALKQKPQL